MRISLIYIYIHIYTYIYIFICSGFHNGYIHILYLNIYIHLYVIAMLNYIMSCFVLTGICT
jgi:hypothetical protein